MRERSCTRFPPGVALLEVLLDARAPVFHVCCRQEAVGGDAASAPRAGPARDAAAEDPLRVVGASSVEVLTDDLLEQDSAADRMVENLRAGLRFDRLQRPFAVEDVIDFLDVCFASIGIAPAPAKQPSE